MSSIRRPLTPHAGEEFDLYYVRTGRPGDRPLLIIPGGPGMASIGGYRGLRRRAADAGLDVIMVEHRGVGMSRHDDAGADLPDDALTIEQVVDDVAAVLDDAEVPRRRRLRNLLRQLPGGRDGVRHPGRVGAMILDSRCSTATTSRSCATNCVGCCGTGAIRIPPTWRPRCASWPNRAP